MSVSVKLHLGDCLEYMRAMPDKSVDAVITDPPYGIDKEEWDSSFDTEFIVEGLRAGSLLVVIPGIWALGKCIVAMGESYLWTIGGHKPGAMTNTPIGFNNWQPVVLGGKTKQRIGVDAFDFTPTDAGVKFYHSCQKPLNFMRWLVERTTQPGDTIFDPFMGSGTTGVACVQTGRNFIGCELDPEYFAIAQKRIADAQLQTRMNI